MIENFIVHLIVFDFDGVMTDNRVMVNEHGVEAVWVSRADGLGVSILRNKGIPMLILSTEENLVVSARAKKLKLPVLYGIQDKAAALQSYCKQQEICLKNVLFVGNDVNDLAAMKLAGMIVVPNDAHIDVKAIAHIVLKTAGGFGVVRELADILEKSATMGRS